MRVSMKNKINLGKLLRKCLHEMFSTQFINKVYGGLLSWLAVGIFYILIEEIKLVKLGNGKPSWFGAACMLLINCQKLSAYSTRNKVHAFSVEKNKMISRPLSFFVHKKNVIFLFILLWFSWAKCCDECLGSELDILLMRKMPTLLFAQILRIVADVLSQLED